MAERLEGFLFHSLPYVKGYRVSKPNPRKGHDFSDINTRKFAIGTADGLTGSKGALRAASLAVRAGLKELRRPEKTTLPDEAEKALVRAIHKANQVIMHRGRMGRLLAMPVGETTLNLSQLISFQNSYGLVTAGYGDTLPLIKQPGERLYMPFDRYAYKAKRDSAPQSLGAHAILSKTVARTFVPLQPEAWIIIPTDGAIDHWHGGPEHPEHDRERMDAIDIFLDKDPSVQKAAEWIADNPYKEDDATVTAIKIGPLPA